jgi:hypothetical protein
MKLTIKLMCTLFLNQLHIKFLNKNFFTLPFCRKVVDLIVNSNVYMAELGQYELVLLKSHQKVKFSYRLIWNLS